MWIADDLFRPLVVVVVVVFGVPSGDRSRKANSLGTVLCFPRLGHSPDSAANDGCHGSDLAAGGATPVWLGADSNHRAAGLVGNRRYTLDLRCLSQFSKL